MTEKERKTMPDKTDDRKINPNIKEVWIGKKEMRKINVYPLSMADQKKIGHVLIQFAEAFEGVSGDTGMEKTKNAITVVFDSLFGDDLQKVLAVATEEGPEIMDEITDDQVTEVLFIIFEENFMSSVKKLRGLAEKAGLSVLENKVKDILNQMFTPPQSQNSSNITHNTASEISQPKATDKVA